jgi:hypothetical protein
LIVLLSGKSPFSGFCRKAFIKAKSKFIFPLSQTVTRWVGCPRKVRTVIFSASRRGHVRKEKITVGFRGVLFFGSFFCTSKRNEQEK